MKHVAILTYWWSDNNYGQLLQAYALQTYLQNKGYTTEIIRFRKTKETWIDKIFIGFRFLKNFSFKCKNSKRIHFTLDDDALKFREFRTNILVFSTHEYRSYKELKKNPPKADYYICGSDKIWATFPRDFFRTDLVNAYSLNFGKKTTFRIAYAPSLGKKAIPYFPARKLNSNLHRFTGISVREKSGSEFLSTFGHKEVVWVPDPTQLIGAEGYRHFVDPDPTNYQKTWFIYGLNNPSFITSNDIAKEMLTESVDFAYSGANGNDDELINCYPTIPEWLSYMYYASNVITNSYHGCIFCILFHKNFYYVPVLPDKNGLPDERVLSIMNRYEIKDRAIQSLEKLQQVISNPYKPIDWDLVDDKREEFVQVGKDFLAKHLGDSTT
jgi:hypothetical protein